MWTIDATLFDDGSGIETGNVLARGPGRLETRPDRDQPVEHIAIWQKELIIRNRVGPDGKVKQKIVDLVGNRPCFIDKVKEASLDSAQIVRVWLKPRPDPDGKRPTAKDDLTPQLPAHVPKNGSGDHRAAAPSRTTPASRSIGWSPSTTSICTRLPRR